MFPSFTPRLQPWPRKTQRPHLCHPLCLILLHSLHLRESSPSQIFETCHTDTTHRTSTPLAEPGPPPALRVGAIVGVALGGLCIAALVMWCLLSLNRRRRVRRHGRLTRSTTSSMFIQKEPPDGDFYSVRREKLPSLQLTPPLQRRSLVPSFYSQESLSRSGSVVSDLSEMEKASLRGKF